MWEITKFGDSQPKMRNDKVLEISLWSLLFLLKRNIDVKYINDKKDKNRQRKYLQFNLIRKDVRQNWIRW